MSTATNVQMETSLIHIKKADFEKLHEAVSTNDLYCAQNILEGVYSFRWINQKIRPTTLANQKNIGSTLLHVAAIFGHLEIIDLLLEHNANVNITDSYKWTPLHIATRNQNCYLVEKLLKNNAITEVVDRGGHTPLHFATNISIVRLLLHHNADVRARNITGKTPFHTCVNKIQTDSNSTIRIIEHLLMHGANINSMDDYNQTPLAIACGEGYYDVIKFLLVRGADANIQNSEGRSPLLITCINGDDNRLSIVAALLKNGADVNCVDVHGITPLHVALDKGSVEVVKLLLGHGAKIKTFAEALQINKLKVLNRSFSSTVKKFFTSLSKLITFKPKKYTRFRL